MVDKNKKRQYRLISYCSRAERCAADVIRFTVRWGLSEEEKQQLLEDLRKNDFIDDLRYCRAFINDKSRLEHWGIHKIRYELINKGLPEEFIEGVIADMGFKTNREQLRRLIEEKRKRTKGRSAYEINHKLLKFALSKGYPVDDISAVLRFNL